MSISVHPANNPVFPPEIFCHILQCLAERQFEVPLERAQIEALRACALANSQFTQHCQQLLLERIDVFYFHGPNIRRLKRLQDIFSKRPHQLRVVRELSVAYNCAWSNDLDEMTPAKEDPPSSIQHRLLLKFPRITSLTVVIDRSSWVSHTVMTLCRRLIDTYTSQDTLHSLTMENLNVDTLWPLILNSQSLLQLSLRYCLLQPHISDSQNKSIKQLSLTRPNIKAEDFSLISHLTHLEVLNLEDVSIPGDRLLNDIDSVPPWLPPGSLREINAVSGAGRGEVILLDSLTCNIQRLPGNTVYLPRLTTIRVPIKYEDDLEIVESLLPHAPSLRLIEITVNADIPEQLVIVQRIDQAIATSLYMLSGLIMTFDILPEGFHSYGALMQDLNSLVGTLSRSGNPLATFSITIATPFTNLEGLRIEQWDSIALKLGTKDSFPDLRRVNVGIIGYVRKAAIERRQINDPREERELEATFLGAMAALRDREDVKLDASLGFCIA